jgi:hypothetical protein
MSRRVTATGTIAMRPLPGRTGTGKAPAVAKQSSSGPTPERLAQREAMAEGGDASLTTTPLDVALLRGRVSRAQHAAGRQYAFLWHATGHRIPRVGAVDLDPDHIHTDGMGISLSDRTTERLQTEFAVARDAVKQTCGAGGLAVLEDLVIYEKWPSWAWTSKEARLSALQAGAMSVATNALTALSGLLAGSQRHSRDGSWDEPSSDDPAESKPIQAKRPRVAEPAKRISKSVPSLSAFDDDAADTEDELARLLDAELASRRTNGRLSR